MLPAQNRGVGMNFGFPDVCLTPVGPIIVPIPYPNFALNAQAVLFAPIVFLSMMNALNVGSIIAMTHGDEPGVAHPVDMSIGTFVMGDPIVLVEKLPGIHLTSPTMGNAMNNSVGAVVVPSVTPVMYSRAEGPGVPRPGARLDGRALEGLARALDAEPGAAVASRMVSESAGCVAVRAFSASAVARAYHEIGRLSRAGMRALVLDLRGCPGGDLDAAIRFAADFLHEGAVVARVVDADGDEIVRRAALAGPHRFPVAVLVDGSTASAAEVFAGALRAHGRARLFGQPTYGKGSAQQVVHPAAGDRAIYATVARCLLPDGSALDGRGLAPDVVVPAGEDALAHAVAALVDAKALDRGAS